MKTSTGWRSVSILPFGMVNAFIVHSDRGCVLVDAGLPGSTSKFDRALQSIGRNLSDVSLIVVTHGHIDHAGGAFDLREKTGAPIVAHEREVPFLSGQRKMTFCPTRPFGRWFLQTGAPKRSYHRFSPDIILEGHDQLDLQPYGLNGRVVPTPGHTPGSVSVVMADGDAFVGDMLASGILLGGIAFKNRPERPPFEEEPHQVADELERLVHAGSKRFYLGHGGPLNDSQVGKHLARLRRV